MFAIYIAIYQSPKIYLVLNPLNDLYLYIYTYLESGKKVLQHGISYYYT